MKTLGDMYNGIGAELVGTLGGKTDGIFLYAEAGPGWMSPSIYEDLGDKVIYHPPSERLTDLLFDVWEAEDPDKRWAAMHYVIVGGSFSVVFDFPEKMGAEDMDYERRDRITAERYGDKPIDYGEPPDFSGWELKPDGG